VKCGDLRYGRATYDYQEGTLVFIAPGQVIGVENGGESYQPKGYTFFSYQSNEALHLSERERKIVMDLFSKIEYELEHTVDKHSKRLIVSSIEMLLNYCIRFYDRQFITRDNVHKGILERFEQLLNAYFQSDKPQAIGFPSVAWCTNELNLPARYFGELIKKETGENSAGIYTMQGH
jgi:AraC family transcriptional activator of pobA